MKKKFINTTLLILIVFAYVYPIIVFSLEDNQNNTTLNETSNEETTKEDENNSESQINENVINDTTSSNIEFKENSVLYTTHVQDVGWQKYVKDGEMAGTTGRSLRLEAIKIKLKDTTDGNIEYRTHIQNVGWGTIFKKNDEQSGTSGMSLRIEAIEIKLTGKISEYYDVYYRVHAQGFGWLDWAKNGEQAGTAGYSYRLEGIQIKLVKKGEEAPGKTEKTFVEPLVSYSSHVQNVGWQSSVRDGQTSGTSGQSLRLEGIKIKLSCTEYAGSIIYQTHIQNIGWQDPVRDGEISGTSGRSLRLEAIRIHLEGEISNHYDIYYRAHAQEKGWLDWAKNGESAGTLGYGYRLEAIEIKLIKKGQIAPENVQRHFIKRNIMYSGYDSSKWQTNYDGAEIGIIKNSLQAININLIKDEYSGNVSYSTYITGDGWQNYVANGANSNKTGNRIEAIKIKLEGEIASHYDVYYSTYISNMGWTGWSKNNEPCGNVGYENKIEKIKIKLIEKNSNEDLDTNNNYVEDELKVKYTTYVDSNWQNYVQNKETSGTTGQSKPIRAMKIKLNKKTIKGTISYSAHVSNIGWMNWNSDNSQAGVIKQKVEAIKIKLEGEIAEQYDIYYRVHVSNVGWMGWTSNGQAAGTQDAGLSVEAIQVVLVEKGKSAPENTDNGMTTSPFLAAKWVTEDGHKYYYDLFGNKITGCGYKIGDATHYFGPTGIYLGMNNLEVLDISAHNGVVDWQAVASSGVYGVILRVAASAEYRDSRLKENVAGCKKYGIPYGIYIYSYAENYSEGQAYANFTRALMNEFDMHPTLGIFLDLEENNVTKFMGPTEYTAVVKGFYSVIPEAEVLEIELHGWQIIVVSVITQEVIECGNIQVLVEMLELMEM